MKLGIKRPEISEIVSKISVDKGTSIIKALKKMDELSMKLLIVSDNKIFLSLLSIGDIQRAIIKNISLDSSISKILREKITVCFENDDMEKIKSEMIKHRSEFMPVLDSEGKIADLHFWEDIFSDTYSDHFDKLDSAVVIIAGGKGTRLKPLTNVIPKPLVPIGDKPIIQLIIESFNKVGMKKFFLLVNYKANLIENFINEIANENFETEFIYENEPLGTAGSLYLLKGKVKETFFVSNCDILIDQDYSEIYKFHKENKNELTIVGALKHYSIPYGTLEVEDGGFLRDLIEKPDLTLIVNSGLYILEPHLLNEIPENEYYHITNLIDNIKKRNGRVGVFPVSEMCWLDIGDWKEFNRAQEIATKKHFV